jgi:hypothetical protein
MQVFNRFGEDLKVIKKSLINRHTGVYKWFNNNAANGQLTKEKFQKAISDLNVPGMYNSGAIYDALTQI